MNKRIVDDFFDCASRAVYDNKKINREFFSSNENRALFYPIASEVIKVNIAPFIEGLLSTLNLYLPKGKEEDQDIE